MLLYTRVVVVGGQGEDPEGEDAQGEPPVLRVVPQGQLQPSTQPCPASHLCNLVPVCQEVGQLLRHLLLDVEPHLAMI